MSVVSAQLLFAGHTTWLQGDAAHVAGKPRNGSQTCGEVQDTVAQGLKG